MKKLLLLFILIGFALSMYAQVSKTVPLATAGTLSSTLTVDELNTITNLTLTGNIDARDFKTMRDLMPVLAKIDLSNTTIAGYTGTEGTSLWGNTNYVANTIPEFAFELSFLNGKISLTSMILPLSVTEIGKYAFCGCNELISVNIPESVQRIQTEAFSGCIKMVSIFIPKSIFYLEDYVFGTNAAFINVDPDNQAYSSIDGVLFNKNQSTLISCPLSKSGSYTVPSSVRSIEIGAFENCNSLTSITLSNGLLSIKNFAFRHCSGLTSLILPDGLTSLGSQTFFRCDNLSSIVIPASVHSIDMQAISYCENLRSITVKSNTPSNLNLGQNVFWAVDKNTCILNVPSDSKVLYQAADQWKDFQNIVEMASPYEMPLEVTAGGLASLLPQSVRDTLTYLAITGTIDARDFKTMRDLMPALAEVDLSGVTIMAYSGTEGTFGNVMIDYIGDELPKSAFQNKGTLSSIIIPSTVTSIGDVAFQQCIKLKSVNFVLPSSLKSIGWIAFTGCTALESISIPASTNLISELAFVNCSNLKSVSIPASLKSIGKDAFLNTQAIFSVDANNSEYSALEGMLLSKYMDYIYVCTNYKTGELFIPTTVMTIGDNAFHGCNKLTSISLPKSVYLIRSNAFANCDGLTSFYSHNPTPPSLFSDAFNNFNKSNCTLYVPFNSETSYANANQWKEFGHIESITKGYNISEVETLKLIRDNAPSDSPLKNEWAYESNINEWPGVTWELIQDQKRITSLVINSKKINSLDVRSLTYLQRLECYWNNISELNVFGLENLQGLYCGGNQITTLNLQGLRNLQHLFCYANLLQSLDVSPLSNLTQLGCWDNMLNFLNINGLSKIERIHVGGNSLPFSILKQLLPLNLPITTVNLNGMSYSPQGVNGIFTESTINIGKEIDFSSEAEINGTPTLFKWYKNDLLIENTNQTGRYTPSETDIYYCIMTNAQFSGLTLKTSKIMVINGNKSVNIATPGTLSTLLTTTELNTIIKLTLTGTIDARDFKTMRDLMPNLTKVDLSGVTIAEYFGTEGTIGTGYITYPANVIPQNAFCTISSAGKTSLTLVNFPSSITAIENYALLNCTGLTSVNIPSMVTTIGDRAFDGCTSLSSLTFDSPSLLTKIRKYAFRNCIGLSQVTIPSSVGIIDYGAFYGCTGITSVTFEPSSGLTSIGIYAFRNCNKLATIKIPSGVSMIDYGAFYMCSEISSFDIPTSVTTIGGYAFGSCSKLTAVTIPSTVTSIGNCAFLGTNATVDVDASNANYSSIDGLLFNKDKSRLMYCPVTKTGSFAIPSSVNTVAEDAFYKCSGLTSITLSAGLTTLEDWAFEECTGLTTISLPASLVNIASYSFYNCTGLISIHANNPIPVDLSSKTDVFFGINKTTCTLYVPAGSENLYKAASQWRDFTHIVASNQAPVANAGADQAVNEGATVQLDGSGSTDADGNPLTYQWTAPAGITLSSANVSKPTFTAPEVTQDTPFTFTIVVNDGTVSSTADLIVIMVKQVNKAPVADAGNDQTVNEGSTVQLDGTGSTDADGDVLQYVWIAPAGIVLSSETVANPTFLAPEVTKDTPLIFLLYVGDGILNSDYQQVIITVKQANKVPVANAGADQSVNEGSTVQLDGSGSTDADGNPLTYQWTAPAGITLSSANVSKPTFTAPEVIQDTPFAFTLVVNDGTVSSTADQVVITVKQINKAPIAYAGTDQSVNEGSTVTLNGSLSSDPDGTVVTYFWAAPAGVTLNSPSVAKPTFTAPEVTADKTYTFSLVVNDGTTSSTADEVIVTVKQVNKVPVANAGLPQTANERAIVTLDGSRSIDPDGDLLTFSWISPYGITLNNSTTNNPTFIAPDISRTTGYTFTLTVSDGAASATAITIVTVNPVTPYLMLSARLNGELISESNLHIQLFKKNINVYVEKPCLYVMESGISKIAMEQGDWIALVSPKDSKSFIPTYSGNSVGWESAQTITIPDGGIVSTTIDCIPVSSNVENGSGDISGYIYVKEGTKSISIIQGPLDNGTPVSGVLVQLFKKGEKLPISTCFTDTKGFYQFDKIRIAEYELVVQLPGYAQSNRLPANLTESVQSTVVYIAVNTTTQVITNTNQQLDVFTFKIYPNPFNGPVTIDMGETLKEHAILSVFNIQGGLIMQQELSGPIQTIDMSGLVPGSYLMKVKSGENIQSKIIIKK